MQSQRQVCEEVEEMKECRICLEKDREEYIAPCACRGTGQYVHFRCFQCFFLKNRQAYPNKNKDPFDVGSCNVCKSPYMGVIIEQYTRLLTCQEICGLESKKRLIVWLFLLGNILLIAALFGGILIFFQQHEIAVILGAIWYALIFVFLVLLQVFLCRSFLKAINLQKIRMARIQSPILVPGVLSMQNLDNVSISDKSQPQQPTI